MKTNKNKKGRYAVGIILLAALCVFGVFITAKGLGKNKIGRAKNIELGLDLAGGVSITYEVDGKNVSDKNIDDTVYKLQKRVEGYSTESEVYRQGKNRINIEIPGVTDANKILDELGQPGTLAFMVQDGKSMKSTDNRGRQWGKRLCRSPGVRQERNQGICRCHKEECRKTDLYHI